VNQKPFLYWPDIITLLSDLVVFNNGDFKIFLKKLILLTHNIISCDSCLIYFHDRENKKSTLVASSMPHKTDLGNITMIDGEGITGWVAQNKKTVVIEKNAYKDDRFKFFKELPEDKFEAFLSVPIFDGNGVVGVMNFQNKVPFKFDTESAEAIEAIAKIIASAFAKKVSDRKVIDLEEKLLERKIIEKAKGILMEKYHLSENDAFKKIRSEAMDKRKSMRQMAEAIILVLK